MAVSTIPAVKALIEARLVADPAIGAASPAVQVTYGVWHAGLERESVLLGDTRPGGEVFHAQGGSRDEEYVLEIRVRVTQNVRELQRVTTERAFTLTAAIENSLRAWGLETPAFGGTVTGGGFMHWAVITAVYHRELVLEASQERIAEVTIEVSCKAQV